MKKSRNQLRLRRAAATRHKIREIGRLRLSIYRTPRHTYAQISSADGARVYASASSLEKEIKEAGKNGGNVAAAKIVGETIAKRAQKAGVKQVAFDRSGYIYHAEAARESGLEF
jgi:large subunit ribosomal protein L18